MMMQRRKIKIKQRDATEEAMIAPPFEVTTPPPPMATPLAVTLDDEAAENTDETEVEDAV